MIKATNIRRQQIIDLLTESFSNNLSVNFIVKQDAKKNSRIKALMNYSFDICSLFGEVFIAEDSLGCALILYPQIRKTTLYTIWLDIKLIFKSIGLFRVIKALKREAAIKRIQPASPMLYLWFIGVDPKAQHSGIGRKLLKEVIALADAKNLTVYLETSTQANLPWYEKAGFEIYHSLDLGYQLFFLKRPFLEN